MQLLAQSSPSARNVRAVRRAFLNVETMRSLRLGAGDHILIRAKRDSSAPDHDKDQDQGQTPVRIGINMDRRGIINAPNDKEG